MPFHFFPLIFFFFGTTLTISDRAIQAGSPFNVPAGHYANMDKVVAHYRQQHLDEEDRKAQLAKKKAEAAQKE